MISLGVPPSVSTSTGMYMIMFSTGASTLMFYTYGALNLTFGFWLGFWCSFGILIGVSLVNHLIKIYKRQSLLVFFLVFMLALSAVLVFVQNIIQYLVDEESEKEQLWKISSIC